MLDYLHFLAEKAAQVRLSVNEHRADYASPARWAKDIPEQAWISQAALDAMAANLDRESPVTTVDMWVTPTGPADMFRVAGDDLEQVLMWGAVRLINALGEGMEEREFPTEQVQDLIDLTNLAHVWHFDSNEHLTFGQGNSEETVASRLYNERGLAGDFLDPEDQAGAVETNILYELQVYPRTPIGFTKVAGTDILALLRWGGEFAQGIKP